ncbi:MAG TPA: DUF1343 domain-containing protein [Candidatus Coprenecus pullistercoris]|nr:DUF1343 domain-containing protein [Candidatus Coprenecus pullistercoris]
MFSFRTTSLDRQEDNVLRRGSIAVLCDQTAWNPETGEYIFGSLARGGNLRKVFHPAGWDGEFLSSLGMDGCMFIPLRPAVVGDLPVDAGMLEDIDALVVDYQDTGSRYDSMTAALYGIFQLIHHSGLSVSVYILDRENMCGRQVEGTALCPGSQPEAGIEGIPHRHGLTLGELANLFYTETGAHFPLHIISSQVRPNGQYLMPWSIPPREDVPGLFTSAFYCGMILLSSTNVSCGQGTLRPYEFFGAPFMRGYMDGMDSSGFADAGVLLRKAAFRPGAGIHAGQTCYGFQMLPVPGVPYHSLAHALRILRQLVSDGCGADVTGLDAMAGDEVMTAYVRGGVSWTDLKEHVKVEEQKWIRKARRYMLYDDQIVRVKTFRTNDK